MIVAVPESDAVEWKLWLHGDALHGMVSSKVVQGYVGEFRQSCIKRNFAKTTRNILETDGVDLRAIQLIE